MSLRAWATVAWVAALVGVSSSTAFSDASEEAAGGIADVDRDLPTLLQAPSGETPSWALLPIPRQPADRDGQVWVQARWHDAPIFSSRTARYGHGVMRAGTVIRAAALGRGPGCSGRWFRLQPFGYVCTTRGFRGRNHELEPPAVPRAATPDQVLPYRYAAVSDRSAYRYDRLPSESEYERVHDGRLGGLASQLDGDYFVTVDGEVEHEGRTWVRTAQERYVRRDAVEMVEASELHGELDPDGLELPMAFVFGEERPVYRLGEGRAREVGVADVYARFHVEREVEVGGERYVVGPGGLALKRDAVRVATQSERPDDIPEGDRWVHVDLAQQVLMAYEGDTPIFATLVSSGKEGYDTPTGVFRVRHKYVSTTMSGDDPTDGVYDVAEVPWTQYYYRSYALHGAYWHDAFGAVRSHGCTNIAPADARWLFLWTTPVLPEGWHGIREEGVWVVNTNEEPETA